jgi:hypothetical protein
MLTEIPRSWKLRAGEKICCISQELTNFIAENLAY